VDRLPVAIPVQGSDTTMLTAVITLAQKNKYKRKKELFNIVGIACL
jgi:hypothetical protein